MKPKLLVTASTFPRWKGDTEPRFVLDLALAMREEFDITVLVPAAPGAASTEDWNGVTVKRFHYFPIHKWETLCYPGAIVPRIKEKKVRGLLVPFLLLALAWNLLKESRHHDAVHAHWLIPQGIMQSFFSTPYLVTGHGGDVTSLNKGFLLKLKRRCIKKASAVTVVSSYLAEQCEKDFGRTPEVLSMGCDTTNFSPDHRVPGLFDANGRPVILFVGRLAEKKGVRYLIEAMEKVDAQLVIAGGGPLEEALRQQAAPLGQKIRFLGAKTHDELAEIYASADIFAAPSIVASDGDTEGFGLVFLEAMASGLPVVASRSGGIPDIVKDGENGLLVPPKDADALAASLNELIASPSLHAKLRSGAIQTKDRFDYKVIGASYARLINGILCKH